jgi:hypothetical protein
MMTEADIGVQRLLCAVFPTRFEKKLSQTALWLWDLNDQNENAVTFRLACGLSTISNWLSNRRANKKVSHALRQQRA